MLIARFAAALLLSGISLPTIAGIEPGDFLFLHGRLLDCPGADPVVVDYAEVTTSGTAEFRNGVTLHVTDSDAESIADEIATHVGKKTGHTPKALSIRLIPGNDTQRISRQLMRLLDAPACRQNAPPSDPAQGYNRRLASADTRPEFAA